MKTPTQYQLIDAVRNHALFEREYIRKEQLHNIASALHTNHDNLLTLNEQLQDKISELEFKILQLETIKNA